MTIKKPLTLKEQLIRDSEAFCREFGISEARVATIVMNDGKFFNRIRAGGEFTTTTFERFQSYFAERRAEAGEAA